MRISTNSPCSSRPNITKAHARFAGGSKDESAPSPAGKAKSIASSVKSAKSAIVGGLTRLTELTGLRRSSSLGDISISDKDKKVAKLAAKKFEEDLEAGQITFQGVEENMYSACIRALEEDSLARYLELERRIGKIANKLGKKWTPPSVALNAESSSDRTGTARPSISSVQDKPRNEHEVRAKRGQDGGTLLDRTTAALLEEQKRKKQLKQGLDVEKPLPSLPSEAKFQLHASRLSLANASNAQRRHSLPDEPNSSTSNSSVRTGVYEAALNLDI